MAGPFPLKRMQKWIARQELNPDSMLVQHKDTGVWVPLWFLAVASGQGGEPSVPLLLRPVRLAAPLLSLLGLTGSRFT